MAAVIFMCPALAEKKELSLYFLFVLPVVPLVKRERKREMCKFLSRFVKNSFRILQMWIKIQKPWVSFACYCCFFFAKNDYNERTNER